MNNKLSNVNEIKKSYLCYGCGTCNVVCSKGAITMQYDNIGRLHPKIDEQKCIDCGLCYKLCPSLDLRGIQLPDAEDCYTGKVLNTYIGKSTDERIYRNSQSGGLVTAILKYLFDTQKIDAAIVCKVIDEIEYTPKATLVTSAEQLYDSQRSSYVPIDMVSAIKGADQYNSFAVVGTGCHIQGFNALANFKPSFNERIKYKLGLICDRTLCKTSTDVLYGELYANEKKRIVWRDKSTGYKEARLLIQSQEGIQTVLPRWQRMVLKDPFTNPRCRICFDKLNTNADIVLGDPWGMNNVDWQNGTSVILTRTEQGESLIQEMKSKSIIVMNPAPLSEVITGQHIELRKDTVASAICIYKEQGWLTPSYADKLSKIARVTHKPEMKAKILSFISNTALTKQEIVSKNIKYLKKEATSRRFRKYMKPLQLVKRIIKKL